MINHIFSSFNQKCRKPLRGKAFCYSESFEKFFVQSSDSFIIKYLKYFDRSFCTCKSASLSVELDVGINRVDLVSLWVMRHTCNQACFLAMNIISSNAVELQSEGQSLLNQDNFIVFPVLSFKLLGFNIPCFVLLLFRERAHAYM